MKDENCIKEKVGGCELSKSKSDKNSRLAEIEKEIQKRKKEPLRNYNFEKVHLKQMIFHKNDARVRFVFGGNRTGKTECGAVEVVWLALGIHPYKTNLPCIEGWVVSLSTQVQRDVAQAKILKYLPKRDIVECVMLSGSKDSPKTGIIDFLLVRNALGGVSKIGFKSCDQGREKFQGTSLDFVWFDEEPPKDIFDECRMRVLDRQGKMFATMTPLKGRTWVYDEIYMADNENIWYECMEWADNPYLDEREISMMSAVLSDDELQSRRFGKFRDFGGLVYSEFDPSVHVIEPFEVPKEWYCGISVDPGLHNPLSCHFYAVDGDGTIFVIAEHYLAGVELGVHAKAIKDIAAHLEWGKDSFGRIEALIDSAANQHTLACTKSVAELFFEHGIAVNTHVNKDVFAGIARVKALLKPADGSGVRIKIFRTCRKMIEEMKGYYWDIGDKPVKKDDHAMDDLRYFVSSRPQAFISPPKPKSRIAMDKERLIKELGLNIKD